MMNILFVEDDVQIQEMVTMFFTSEQHQITCVDDGMSAIAMFSQQAFDIILLDLMLPKGSGLDVLREIRSVSTIPVIVVTAKDSDHDKLIGLNLGADDYITKPFSLVELLARMKANVRRATLYNELKQTKDQVIGYRDITINITQHTVSRNGAVLHLTHIEFEILRLLVEHPGRAFSKEQLYETIWKEPYYGNEHVLNTHMNRLRNKLENQDGAHTIIKTLWGIGYKLEDAS